MKKRLPHWFRATIIVLGAVATFLLLSTLYDFINGDVTLSRIVLVAFSAAVLLVVFIIFGYRRIRRFFERGVGM
jgi:hypothetical protein